MTEFLLGVLASIAAAAVIGLVPPLRAGFFAFWILWRQSSRFADMYRAGISEIHLDRDKTNPLDVINSAQEELVYVGVSPNPSDLDRWCRESFEGLLSSGIAVAVVFWDVAVDESLLEDMASYYMMSAESLRDSLSEARTVVESFRRALPQQCRNNFKFMLHTRVLTDSVFLVDTGMLRPSSSLKGHIHLDQKLFGLGKSQIGRAHV